MRPLRIYLKNFMNHRLTEVDCTNFQSVLIVGKSNKNERISNAVGKTTIFRAIEYVLFNQSHATTLDKVVRDGKKKAVVEFDFELGGEIYRIYRHRTSTGSADVRFYKKVDGEFVSICGRTASTTDAIIRDVIKISHKAFTYSVLFRQADLTGITSVADPKKRKEILKEPLNLSMYTKLEDMAVDRRRPLKRKIDQLEGSIQVLGNPEEDIKKTQIELVDTDSLIKNHQLTVETNLEIIACNRSAIEELKTSLGQHDIEIHKKVAELEEKIKKLSESHGVDAKRLTELSNVIMEREEELRLADEKQIQKRLDELLKERPQEVENIQAAFDKVCSDELKGSEIIAAVRTQMRLTQRTLPEEDKCPTCHQSITAFYREQLLNEVNAKLKKQQENLEHLEDAMSKCRRKKTKVEDQLKTAKDRDHKITNLEEQVVRCLKQQKNLRSELERLYEDQSSTRKRIHDDEIQSVEYSNLLNTLRAAAKKSNAPTINKRIFDLNEQIVQLEAKIKEDNKIISNLSSVVGGLKERIKTRTADKDKIVQLNDELIKVKRELKIAQMVVDAFSNRGIPNFIIQTILDELQFEANASLKELRPELDVHIDADLNFEYRRDGLIRDYTQLSHGQHVYIALAFKRGLARVIQKRMGTDLRMLEFDEVDANFDEAGVDAFADAIRKWQKDFTIFVITHNKDLKDKFSHAIQVEEGEDGAEARLVTSW